MACFKPLHGFYSSSRNSSGKRSIVFSRHEGLVDRPVDVPCGQCIGCRLEHSRQWAIRCVHEASMHDFNCFITLTYAPCYLPSDSSLVVRDFQLFMKRLRKLFICRKGKKGICCFGFHKRVPRIRFFHCGEYGEVSERPHYHACLFGFDFPDKVQYFPPNPRGQRLRDSGIRVYWSEFLARLWPYGTHEIGDVTFESAAYVARYVCKKVSGEQAEAWYRGRKPEYVTMSRRPGIAGDWFRKFKDSVFPHDFVVIRGGVKCKPPKFYFSQYDLTDHFASGRVKSMRKFRAKDNPDNSDDRLQVREVVKTERFKQLKRSLS